MKNVYPNIALLAPNNGTELPYADPESEYCDKAEQHEVHNL